MTPAHHPRRLARAHTAAAVGSLLGAVASSSCCMLPLMLFAIGASGAWIGALVRLAPWQPYFITATVASLGYGYWLAYRSSRTACGDGPACATPRAHVLVRTALVLATMLVAAAIGFNFLMPLLDS